VSTPSPALAAFVGESPIDRRLILRFVQQAAAATAAGARVLDAGAGDSPYRELFAHCEYAASDWTESVHPGARLADIVAPLHDIPVEDASFDAVLCTQVLEHVPDPGAVLAELHRVLAPGGRLWLTVPFVGELHEEPHDFFRYTTYALRAGCERAGFETISIEPLSGYFTTLAYVARSCAPAIGLGTSRAELGRRVLAAGLRAGAAALPRLDRLDSRRALPLGYGVRASKRS
jgi:SAM-dependent methyltransferase